MPHPDGGLIHAWLDGELDATEAARVEALVASDAEWAAAAAEARGLIAASARIVGALDRVPAGVVPQVSQAGAPRRGTRWWVWRAAAVVVLMAGSAVVLERGKPELVAPKVGGTPLAPNDTTAASQPVAPTPSRTEAEPAHTLARRSVPVAAPAPVRIDSPAAAAPASKDEARAAANDPVEENKSNILKKELDNTKSAGAVATAQAARAGVGGTGSGAPPATAMRALNLQGPAQEKLTRLMPSCFEQREPADSAMRIIRLDAGALADSIRLEKLTLRGDTLAAVNGRLTAVRVPCPRP